jgi:hypothetical protein
VFNNKTEDFQMQILILFKRSKNRYKKEITKNHHIKLGKMILYLNLTNKISILQKIQQNKTNLSLNRECQIMHKTNVILIFNLKTVKKINPTRVHSIQIMEEVMVNVIVKKETVQWFMMLAIKSRWILNNTQILEKIKILKF